MKILTLPFTAFIAACVFTACTKAPVVMPVPIPPAISGSVTDSSTAIKGNGQFNATAGISVTGSVKIYLQSTQYKLLLDSSFSISSGPDLKVYLAKEYPAVNFINLGSLQSNSGIQLYNIPGMPDFTQYKYVLVHCQQYNHLFAVAPLK